MIALNLRDIFHAATGEVLKQDINQEVSANNLNSVTGLVQVNAEIKVNKLDDGLIVIVAGELEIPTQCDRCLEEYVFHSSFEFDLKLSNSEVIHLKDNLLDLEDEIQKQIILSLPIQKLCAKNCKGLCPTCGTNLNTHKCKCQKQIITRKSFTIIEGNNGTTEKKNHK